MKNGKLMSAFVGMLGVLGVGGALFAAPKGITVQMSVTDKGFEPSTIEVKKGQPVELVFTRKTDQTCIKEVILDNGSSKIEKPLPLNKPVAIKTKFAKAGENKFACKMDMFKGTVKVQ